MNFTKNEKSVMRFLINDARISDAEIGRKLNISLQAGRNIRKKLEKEKVIKNYSAIIDYEKIGLNVFAIILFKVTRNAWEKFSEPSIRKWLLHPNTIDLYRVPASEITHIIKYGFCDLNEMHNFFHELQTKYGSYIEIYKSYIVSNGNILRHSDSILVNEVMNGKNGIAKPSSIK